MVLSESTPGAFRIDTTGQGHNDRLISLALWRGTGVEYAGQVRLGDPGEQVPRPRQAAMFRAHQNGPAPSVVGAGKPRPVERLLQFRNAQRHPGYVGPAKKWGHS